MKELNKLKMINLAFWTTLTALILSFILGFVSGALAALGNVNLTYLFLMLGYFSVLLFYTGISMGFVAMGEIFKNKLILYLAYLSGALLIFYVAFYFGSLYLYWEKQVFPPLVYVPLIVRVLPILAFLILSLNLFLLKSRLGIFALLSSLFFILSSLTSFLGLFFFQPLLFFASLSEVLAHLFVVIIFAKARNLRYKR